MPRIADAAVVAALAVAYAAVPAAAQAPTASNAPFDVSSEKLLVQNARCLAIYSGHVEALQGTNRLRANTLNVYAKPGAGPRDAHAAAGAGLGAKCGELDRMEADGSVFYATPQEVVKGDHAVYLADDKTITVTGDVVISQGKNVVVGDRLVVNTVTGEATMQSNATGRGQSDRVRSVIYPNQSGSPFGAAPASH